MIRICLVLAAILGAALGATACGVPLDSAARPLASPTSPSTTPTAKASSGTATGPRIFLVRGTGLVAVTRTVTLPHRVADQPVNLPAIKEVLTQLTAGPTATESAGGLRTAVAATPAVMANEPTAPETAVLRIDTGFSSLPSSEQTLAIAQIVLTLTLSGAAERVLFLDDKGSPIGIPLPDGTLANRPLAADDYATLEGS